MKPTQFAEMIGRAFGEPQKSVKHWISKFKGHVAAGRLRGARYIEDGKLDGKTCNYVELSAND